MKSLASSICYPDHAATDLAALGDPNDDRAHRRAFRPGATRDEKWQLAVAALDAAARL